MVAGHSCIGAVARCHRPCPPCVGGCWPRHVAPSPGLNTARVCHTVGPCLNQTRISDHNPPTGGDDMCWISSSNTRDPSSIGRETRRWSPNQFEDSIQLSTPLPTGLVCWRVESTRARCNRWVNSGKRGTPPGGERPGPAKLRFTPTESHGGEP